MSSSRFLSRRRFVALSGASAGAVLFTACQPPAPTAAPAAAPTPQVVERVVTQVVTQVVVTPTSPPAVKGGLDVWDFPKTDDDQQYVWQPLLQRFKKRYPEITPRVEVLPWGGRREKMMAAFAAGSPPDAAYVNSDTLSLFGSSGVLQDVSPIVAKEVWDDMPADVIKSGITWRGKKILVPAFLFGASPLANTELLKQLGYPADKKGFTWSELLELGGKAKEKEMFATSRSTTSWGDFVESVWQAGGTVYSEDATKVLLEQPAAEEALTFYAELFQKGYVPKEGAVGSEQEVSATAVNYFYTGKQVLSAGADGAFVTRTVQQAPNVKFALLEPLKNKQPVTLSNSAGFGVFNKAKNPDTTAIWLGFLMEPENLGFYCSLAGQSPSRNSAQTLWVADANARMLTNIQRPFWRTNQDANYFWQEGKVTTAPHFQAAVLGKKSVKQALADATKELQKIVDDFWTKSRG